MAQVPTTASLRGLLEHALRADCDVMAFCIDEFAEVSKRFSDGMERTQKLNILLVQEDRLDILEALCDRYPTRCKNEKWLEWIEWEDNLRVAKVVANTKRRERQKRRIFDFMLGAMFSDWARRVWRDLPRMGRTAALIVVAMLLSGLGVTQLLQRYRSSSVRDPKGGRRPRQPFGPLIIPSQPSVWPDGGTIWNPLPSIDPDGR